MKWAGQEQVPPERRRERDVNRGIRGAPQHAHDPRLSEAIERGPIRKAAVEARLRLFAAVGERVVALLGRQHHREHVAVEERRVRILLRVAVRVVHAMQNPVAARGTGARTLRHVGEQVEEALPTLGHRKLTVRAETMQIERLAKDRQLPMQTKNAIRMYMASIAKVAREARFGESCFRHLPRAFPGNFQPFARFRRNAAEHPAKAGAGGSRASLPPAAK